MPYESDAQRRFMHKRHPEIARRWDEEMKRKGISHKHLPRYKHKKFSTLLTRG